MENVIVYYSWTGNTEAAALEISDAIGGKTVRLCEEKPRKSFISSAFSAIVGSKSRLKAAENVLPEDVTNIFLGTPVWASHCTPAINTFLGKADLRGKKIFLFFTLASEKAPEKMVKTMQDSIVSKGGEVGGYISLQTRKGDRITPSAFKERIEKWKSTLNL